MISLCFSASALLVAVVLFRTFHHSGKLSIKHLPGPTPGPWLVGMSLCGLFFQFT